MSQTLHTLLQYSERLRDSASAVLQQAETVERQLTQQAEQLAGYRTEYQARHPALLGGSTTVDAIRTHQGFMERLNQAVQQQALQLRQAQAASAAQRQALLALEVRVASVRKLLERRAQVHSLSLSRQDQRLADDAAAHAARRRQPHDTPEVW